MPTPLRKPPKGASKKERRKVASENIATERKAGKPEKQAIAIGLRSADLNNKGKKSSKKSKKKGSK